MTAVHSRQRKLFIAIATGQNVANLPPILELADAGDRFAWVMSDEAERSGYAAGSSEVLRSRRLEELPPVRVNAVSEPSILADAVGRWRAEHREQIDSCTPHIVLSGGTKLSPIGLERGFPSSPRLFLYSADKPVELWVFRDSLAGPPRKRPYERCTLDLPDVLAVNGCQISENRPARQIWPKDWGPSSTYGRDVKETIAWQEDAFYSASFDEENPAASELNVSQVRETLGDDFLLEDLQRIQAEIATLSGEAARLEASINRFYGLRRRWSERAWAKRRAENHRRQFPKLGPAFEEFVARRVRDWLAAHRPRCVSSAWLGVEVVSSSNPAIVLAELDVAIVLRNGMVLHLECKAGQPEVKDMYARITTLQRGTSRLASMWICLPTIPSAQPDEGPNPTWFSRQLQLRERLANAGLRTIDVDVGLERKAVYQHGDQEVTVVPFEESLRRILEPFNPGQHR